MPLFWLAKVVDGKPRYFIQEASWPIYAMLRAAIAGSGFNGPPDDLIELDARRARKVPKAMIGRVLDHREAEALLKRLEG